MAIPRMEVLAFSLLMERELRANDGRPGWKGDLPELLAQRVIREAHDLARAVARLDWNEERQTPVQTAALIAAIAKEAADVGNMAMMVADVCGALVMGPDAPGGDA